MQAPLLIFTFSKTPRHATPSQSVEYMHYWEPLTSLNLVDVLCHGGMDWMKWS